MNRESNLYTILYATALIVVVATLLALVSTGLSKRQRSNIEVEKEQNILRCASLAQELKGATDKNEYIQREFATNVTAALVVDAYGEVLQRESSDLTKSEAFLIAPSEQFDIMRKIESAENKEELIRQLRLPVFICDTPDGEVQVLSCYGSGLWGPIWGYIALKSDMKTVAGALFDHKSETPGLGGEITTDKFRNQFIDKIIFEGTTLTPIKVVKGGAKEATREVDALSGATITSTAVQTMLQQWLSYYEPYLLANQGKCSACKLEGKDEQESSDAVKENNAVSCKGLYQEELSEQTNK